jgi:hypothetical protein
MPASATRNRLALLLAAQEALVFTQAELGDAIGVSKRTTQRLCVGRSIMYPEYLAKLIPAVHARDATLASEMAASLGQTLESLGIVKPPPAPAPAPPPAPLAPPPPPPMPRHLAADAVVCVAAEAMNVPPVQLRPVLLAAFKRGRELGLSCEEVERALDGSSASGAKKSKAG